MKKIILIFIIFIIKIPIVSATSYSEWINIDEYPKEIELMKQYRFYQEEKEGIYLPWDSIDGDYPYIDETNFYYQSNQDEWLEKCTNNDIDQIERKPFYGYKPLVDTPYVLIKPMSGNIKIENIEIMNKDQLITYNYLSCSNCNMQELTVNQDGMITFKMDHPKYSISELTFKINTKDNENTELLINFYESNRFSPYIISLNTNTNTIFNVKEENIVYHKVESKYQYTDTALPKNRFYNPETIVSRCRIKKKYNFHYRIKRNYLDGYYQEKEGYLKDENDFQTLIRYQLPNPIIKEKIIYKNKISYLEKPIYFDKISYVEKPIYVDKVFYKEKPVYLEKIVYQEIPVIEEKIIEKEVYKNNNQDTKFKVILLLSVIGIICIIILINVRKMSIK